MDISAAEVYVDVDIVGRDEDGFSEDISEAILYGPHAEGLDDVSVEVAISSVLSELTSSGAFDTIFHVHQIFLSRILAEVGSGIEAIES